jgi:hypothetical protein
MRATGVPEITQSGLLMESPWGRAGAIVQVGGKPLSLKFVGAMDM